MILHNFLVFTSRYHTKRIPEAAPTLKTSSLLILLSLKIGLIFIEKNAHELPLGSIGYVLWRSVTYQFSHIVRDFITDTDKIML